jgi:UDPglucose 6-dehydrogenase
MQLSIIGSGYVGTTVAACFADLGYDVVNVDIDESIVKTINDGQSPIHEAGLDELIVAHTGPEGTGRLQATTDYDAALDEEFDAMASRLSSTADGPLSGATESRTKA